MSRYLPPGIAPMLSVRRGAKAIEFYQAAFDAVVLFRHDGEDGTVVANLAIGPGQLWVSDEEPNYQNYSPESLQGTTVRLILTVEDPHVVYNQAVEAGATAVCPVRDEHDWRIGKLLDPFGHCWEIGKPIR